jgi:hypothetical protein
MDLPLIHINFAEDFPSTEQKNATPPVKTKVLPSLKMG